MSEPTLKCRHTGQDVPYQIQQGLAPMYVFQLNEQWDAEKRQILRQLMADVPAAADDPNVLFDQLPAYGLIDFHWSWLDKAFAGRVSTHTDPSRARKYPLPMRLRPQAHRRGLQRETGLNVRLQL